MIAYKQNNNEAKYYTFPKDYEIKRFFSFMTEKRVYNQSDVKYILNKYM